MRTLYVDESGNDVTDVNFVVAGVALREQSAARRALKALLRDWPFLAPTAAQARAGGDPAPLKAARAAHPGWLAARLLRTDAPPLGPPPTPRQVLDLSGARDEQLCALEAAGASIRAPDRWVAAGVALIDVQFARWAAAVRAGAARGRPSPGDDAPPAVLTRWASTLGLPAAVADFPRSLLRAYASALQASDGEAWGSDEQPAGAGLGAPDRYLRLLGPVLTAAQADGVDRAQVQGRHVPQAAARGTALAGAARPLAEHDLVALGLARGWARVVRFAEVAGEPGHLLADFTAWALQGRWKRELLGLPVRSVPVLVPEAAAAERT